MIRELRSINRKAFAILLAAGLVGALAAIPLMLELIGSQAFRQGPAPDIPVPLVVALALVRNSVLLAVFIAVGMVLAKRVGLQMPLVSAWTQ